MTLKFLLALSICLSSAIALKKSTVCVIGAGPAGLSMARFISQQKDEFKLIVLEKNEDIGGQWLYSENLTDHFNLHVQSSVYKNMITNGPKELQTYPDFRNHDEFSTVVPHEAMFSYLSNFTKQFDLRKYIQFNTLVKKVSPLVGSEGKRKTQWLVDFQKANSLKPSQIVCDAVAVCNGHENKPNIPTIPGIENYPGNVIHSHSYRRPEVYINKTVVLLGAQFSGIDIGLELSKYAKLIYLSHNKPKIKADFPANIVQVSGIVSANGSNLILKDGNILNNTDAIIFCTGYLHDYPFLEKESGIYIKNNYVYPLWRHIVNAEYPTMGLISARYIFGVWAASYAQTQYFTNVLRGKVTLPSEQDMMKEINKETPETYKTQYSPKFEWELEDLLIQEAGIIGTPKAYRKGIEVWYPVIPSDWVHFKSYVLRVNEKAGDAEILVPKRLQNQCAQDKTINDCTKIVINNVLFVQAMCFLLFKNIFGSI